VAVAPEAEVERRRSAPSPEIFSIFELKKASFGASLVLFFAVD